MVSYIVATAAFLALVALWWRWRSGDASTPHIHCGAWDAWHDRMPGPGKRATLHVTGECTFPTAGYTVELRRHEPQGINPAYLLLDKVVGEPTGRVPQVVTVVKVTYAEATDAKYRFLTILPDQVTMSVREAW